MVRRGQSIPDPEAPIDRVTCRRCATVWNRRRRRGPLPQFCSAACRQAARRLRLRLEREATVVARGVHETVERFRAELAAITPRTPLRGQRILPLLRELAGVPATDARTVQQLYREAVLRWHPDAGGDTQVFVLLQLAHREAKRHQL